MLLLDLPSEVFAKIVGALVESAYGLHSIYTAKHRLVCRKQSIAPKGLVMTTKGTFNEFILDELIEAAAKVDFPKPFFRSFTMEFSYADQLLSTDILCRKVLRRVDRHIMVQVVCAIVDDLVAREWPLNDKVSEQLRAQYAKNVCGAIQAQGFDHFYFLVFKRKTFGPAIFQDLLPAASAAVGNVQMFLNNAFTIEDILTPSEDLLPNALTAAVAANQMDMVSVILRWILAAVKGPWETGTWDEMRSVGRALTETLRVAAKMSRNDIGKLVLQTLIKDRTLSRSVHRSLVRNPYEDCVRYGSSTFFSVALYWKRHEQLQDSNVDPGLHDAVTIDEVLYVITRGRPGLLRHIVKTGRIDVNLVGGETPLWLGLKARRRNMAKALLEEGVDNDGLAPG